MQTVALTATADARTRTDILGKLFRREPAVFVHGFDRPNLRLTMRAKAGGRQQIADFVKAHRGESGIIYCSSRKKTEELGEFLREHGFKALPYHAGLDAGTRSRHQDAFLQEDGVVMVATVAFGMGIDKPDVRFVCHADLPANDRELLPGDRPRRPRRAAGRHPDAVRPGRHPAAAACRSTTATPPRSRSASSASGSMRWCRSANRRAAAGRRCSPISARLREPCGNCDICLEGAEVIDGTIAAQKALSAIVRTGERFGTEHLVNLLCGEETEAILKFGHERLRTFGVGKEHSKNEWRSIFRQLQGAGIIALDVGSYGRWTITEEGHRVLKGAAGVELRKETLAPARQKGPRGATAAALADGSRRSTRPCSTRCKQRRSELAKEQRVPAYVVFADRTLLDMARLRPRNTAEMARCTASGRPSSRNTAPRSSRSSAGMSDPRAMPRRCWPSPQRYRVR